MDIVINASPLILPDKINRLHLLNELFSTVYIPNAVLEEIRTDNKTDVEFNLNQVTFNPLKISNRIAVMGLLGKLHIGEVEVMIGAIENGIKTVVLDDNSARNKAKQLGLDVTGTLGILLKATKNGLITDLEQEIVNLRNSCMYLTDEVIRKIISSLSM